MTATFALVSSAIGIAVVPAGAAPTVIMNPDSTMSLVWDFADASNLTLVNTSIAGGNVTLELLSGNVTDDFESGLEAGTVANNLSAELVTGALVLDDRRPTILNLVIQPGPGGSDATISEASNSTNFGNAQTLVLSSQVGNQMRGVLWFDLSSIPADAIVVDSTLWLYQTGGEVLAMTFTIHPLTTSFDEMKVTWLESSMGSPWITPGGDFDSLPFDVGWFDGSTGWKSADLSRLMDLWIGSKLANHGIIIVPEVGLLDVDKTFYSCEESSRPERRPKVAVNYTLPGYAGAYESLPAGPGTNASFTTASWTNSTFSFASNDFSGGNLSSRWKWSIDPSVGTGWWDVGLSNPGWLSVLGDGDPGNDSSAQGLNFLSQNITGDFVADMMVLNPVPSNNTASGMLMFIDKLTYVGIYLMGKGDGTTVFVMAGEGGSAEIKAVVPWVDYSWAFITMAKSANGVMTLASADGLVWSFVYNYIPPAPLTERVQVGPFVASFVWYEAAIAMFDYISINPVQQPTLEIRARTGNSTSLLDPTWGSWGAALPSNETSNVDLPGMYMQYQASFTAVHDWYTPILYGFSCDYETYERAGTIETEDFAPSGFSSWLTITTAEDDSAGEILYSYSTDHGASWTELFAGGSYTILSSGDSIKIRMFLWTSDTLRSPSIDSVTVRYSAELFTFYLTTPETVVAGEPFSFDIEVRDEDNDSVTSWRGPIILEATDASGGSNATGELSVVFAWITDGGKVTVSGERYMVAETIRIRATSASTAGISPEIVVVPGPVSSITIEPDVSQLMEYTEEQFVATAFDAHGNTISDPDFSWTADPAIGTLDMTTGRVVTLTTGPSGGEGLLTVTADGVSASLAIIVITHIYPPEFIDQIPDQVRSEDSGAWTLDITPYVYDFEDQLRELRWYTTNETLVEVVRGENETGMMEITFRTLEDAFGKNNVTLVLVDSSGMTNSTIIPIDITPVNDCPTIDYVYPLVVHYDSNYEFNFEYYVHDVDDTVAELRLSVDAQSDPYTTVNGMWITFRFPSSMDGLDRYVVVTVSDGELQSSTVVRVTVSGDSTPFVTFGLSDLELNQGEQRLDYFDLDSHFSDPDDDIVEYTASDSHVQVEIAEDGSVDFTAPTDWFGQEYVVFAAVDSSGARAEDGILVTVHQVNQAPSIEGVPDLTVRYDEPFQFDLSPYVSDADDELDSLIVTTDDTHISVIGATLSLMYPRAMDGSVNPVTVTVSDGELSDSWAINVTVSDNHPPVAIDGVPDHEFMEDVPLPYPVGPGLEDLFADSEDGVVQSFEAFSWVPDVNATAADDGQGNWLVWFEASEHYYGSSKVTIRARDSEGALVERTITLTVLPVPDAPALDVPVMLNATEGIQMAVDLADFVTDPDFEETAFTFDIVGDHSAHVFVQGSVLMIEFPEGVLGDEDSMEFEVQIEVIDSGGLAATDSTTIRLLKPPSLPKDNTLLYVALGAMGGVIGVLFVATYKLRKKPFVVHDMMLIHNDGLLIGRHAKDKETGIDENILSGMLTAVLNFVEDSMSANQDHLKSFGFEKYMVLVQRGRKSYAAVVFDGDAPEDIAKNLGEFLGKVERIYRHGIENWTGDVQSDFPAIELLLQSFIKEHSKKAKKGKRASIWAVSKAKAPQS